jgi:hypothetical protein
MFLLLIFSFVNCTVGLNGYEKIMTKTIPFKPGDNLFVETEKGSVEISSWEREQIGIESIKKARAETKEKAMKMIKDIEVNISENKGVVKIEAGDGNNYRVDFSLLVPKRTNPIIEARNGSVEIRGLDGAIEAKTNNGSINFNVFTFIKPCYVSLETNNGDIYVSVPKDPELSIYAPETKVDKVSIGSINIKKNGVEVISDFPTDTREEQLKGKIKLKLRTNNGSIFIREKWEYSEDGLLFCRNN